MADIPSDIGTLAKQIANFEVNSPEDLRRLVEMCRVFNVEASEVNGYAEFEIFAAVRHADRGSRRAKQVTRPMKHAVSLNLLAARRCTAVWVTFRRLFADDLDRKMRSGERRRWNWDDGKK